MGLKFLKIFLDIMFFNKLQQSDRKFFGIMQDILHISSRVKKNMPKNVALALSIKNSLQPKEFIIVLNRLGHYISFDLVLMIETTWEESLLNEQGDYTAILSNILPMAFT